MAAKFQVFLSYAREDAEFAEQLATDLKASGADVWWDQQIKPGYKYHIEIEAAVLACSKMVVILSENSIDSKYVRKEWSYAIDHDKDVIPAVVDKTEKPLALWDLEHVEFGTDYQRGLADLIRSLDLKRQPDKASKAQGSERGEEVRKADIRGTSRNSKRERTARQKEQAAKQAEEEHTAREKAADRKAKREREKAEMLRRLGQIMKSNWAENEEKAELRRQKAEADRAVELKRQEARVARMAKAAPPVSAKAGPKVDPSPGGSGFLSTVAAIVFVGLAWVGIDWYSSHQVVKGCVAHPPRGYYLDLARSSATTVLSSVSQRKDEQLPAVCYQADKSTSGFYLIIGPYPTRDDAEQQRQKLVDRRLYLGAAVEYFDEKGRPKVVGLWK